MFKSVHKIIELMISEEDEAMLESISLVDKPAIERDFMFFSKMESKPYVFEEEGDQRIIVGPSMVPEMRIPRMENGEIYYVYFTKETIAKAAELFLKHNRASAQNTDHKDNFTEDVYVMESWIIEDEYDKTYRKYGFDNLPVGTWMVKMRVNDDKIWKEVKEGKYKGFSVQGDFILGQEKYEKAFAKHKRKYKNVRNKWKKLYKGLSNDEKMQLDEILFLVEMEQFDVFETPEGAMARSKELGLKGAIHSHYDEDLKIIVYMPGGDHEEYENLMEEMESKEEEMEGLDVTGLPDYVSEGATGGLSSRPLSQEKFVTVNPGESKEDYIGRCMSSLQGEFPDQEQRYAVCITEWQGSAQLEEKFKSYSVFEKRVISDFLRDITQQYGLRYFAAVEDLEVGDSVSWSTGGQNPRGKIIDIVREGSKSVPGADFEISGTPDNPGYLIRVYEEDAEGEWKRTDTVVGRKAGSLLKNVDPL